MATLRGLTRLINQLRQTRWDWKRSDRKRIASELGLLDPTTDSDRWVAYRSPDPDFPGGETERPYGFALHGDDLSWLRVTLDEFDMGEVWLEEPERYYEVLKKQYASFRGLFEKAVAQVNKLLGEPLFEGGQDDRGIDEAHPVGWGMIAMAVWPLGESARLILGYQHEDKELPLSLDLYVCPPRSQVR